MTEEKYILENTESFEPKHIFECGQCFRWNKTESGSYIGVFGKNVLEVKKENKKIIFSGVCNGNIQETCIEYFDLKRNYEEIKTKLSGIDKNMKKSIEYGDGIRILNQDLWETLISFIISANNNIPRIKGIIERISAKYGKKIEYKGKTYYTFPTPEELAGAKVEDFRSLGCGFRDKRIYETTQRVLSGEINLENMKNIKDTNLLREELLKIPGVGDKVADCVMLFSTLKRFEVFPIDVWVRRVMNELYIKNEKEEQVDRKEILRLAEEKYKGMAGVAQQYLFYWKREA